MAEIDIGKVSCPFCYKAFKSVGKHLPRCKERAGRDYKPFLASSKRNGGAKVKMDPDSVIDEGLTLGRSRCCVDSFT